MKLIWTYTLLDAYENCNYKGFRKYLAPGDQKVPYVEGPAQAWGNLVHAGFEKRLSHGEPLPPEMEHYAPLVQVLQAHNPVGEQKLGIRSTGAPCGFFECDDGDGRGKIDVTVLKGNTAAIFDWKTSKKPREDPRELAIQALLLKAKYPHLTRIVGHYVWLETMQIGKPHDVSDTVTTWKRVQAMVANIRMKHANNFWPKNENPLCPWCEVPKNECEFRRPIPEKYRL